MELNNELPQEDKELIAKIDERLKHYKLIADNEQQPPVEWKVGEWAWNSPLKGKLALIKELNGNKVNVDDQNGYSEWWQNKHILVKPTKEEIEQHLVKIAEKKYPVGTRFKGIAAPDYNYEIVENCFEYLQDKNMLIESRGFKIWDNGVWAEPITEQKELYYITIVGNSIHITTRFGLDLERAAQAIQETLKNL